MIMFIRPLLRSRAEWTRRRNTRVDLPLELRFPRLNPARPFAMNRNPIRIGTQNVTGAHVAHQNPPSFGTSAAQTGLVFTTFSRYGGAKMGGFWTIKSCCAPAPAAFNINSRSHNDLRHIRLRIHSVKTQKCRHSTPQPASPEPRTPSPPFHFLACRAQSI